MVLGGQSKPNSDKQLTDFWCLDTQYVPQQLSETDLAKKKELTGAIWSQLEYRVKQGSELQDLAVSKKIIQESGFKVMTKVSERQMLLTTSTCCFLYDTVDQVFT